MGTLRTSRPLPHERLAYELARRGLTYAALAREAGLAPSTITKAMKGEPVSSYTFSRIAATLARVPVVAGIELVLARQDA